MRPVSPEAIKSQAAISADGALNADSALRLLDAFESAVRNSEILIDLLREQLSIAAERAEKSETES